MPRVLFAAVVLCGATSAVAEQRLTRAEVLANVFAKAQRAFGLALSAQQPDQVDTVFYPGGGKAHLFATRSSFLLADVTVGAQNLALYIVPPQSGLKDERQVKVTHDITRGHRRGHLIDYDTTRSIFLSTLEANIAPNKTPRRSIGALKGSPLPGYGYGRNAYDLGASLERFAAELTAEERDAFPALEYLVTQLGNWRRPWR